MAPHATMNAILLTTASSTAAFTRRRDDSLQPHVRDEVAVMLVAVRDVEREHAQSRRRTCEERHDLGALLVVHPVDDLVAVRNRVRDRLRQIGKWLATYGRSIYGTRAGPVPPRPWGATTRRGDTVFVHVLSWPDRVLALPSIGAHVRRASLLANGQQVAFSEAPAGITLTLPARQPDEYDQVIVLETTSGRE